MILKKYNCDPKIKIINKLNKLFKKRYEDNEIIFNKKIIESIQIYI
jgi:hypothetical protein